MPIRQHGLPVLVLLTWALVACAPVGQPQQATAEPVVIRASGFGTYENPETDRADPRKRLLARRASRLDAWRNLAEQVYGSAVYGGTTVRDYVLQNDRFRVYVDTHIRGARVVDVKETADGIVETVMELELDPAFRACLSGAGDCPQSVFSGHEPVDGMEQRPVDSLYYLE